MRIDPKRVPTKTLPNGAQMPILGLGTFGSDRFSHEEVANAVYGAIGCGYRSIDCARVYQNEHLIGPAITRAMKDFGVAREELFITSKVWNDHHGKGDVLLSLAQTLKELQLDYLDLFLVHWPFPNYHAPGCDVDSRNPDSKPYAHEDFMTCWRQMERLVDMGLVRAIGTSNITIPKLELILRDARIAPAVNEMELHPHFQQPDLFAYCVQKGVLPIGFSPIGSPSRPERDRTAEDTVDTQDPVILKAAQRLGVHPAIVCLKWAAQRGQVPIPFSVKEPQYIENLRAVVEDPLTAQEMEDIAKIDKNCRLIKGQVFLWEGANGWEDLWDEDGTQRTWEK